MRHKELRQQGSWITSNGIEIMLDPILGISHDDIAGQYFHSDDPTGLALMHGWIRIVTYQSVPNINVIIRCDSASLTDKSKSALLKFLANHRDDSFFFQDPALGIVGDTTRDNIVSIIQNTNVAVSFREEMTGYHHGQKDLILRAMVAGSQAGYISYSEFQKAAHINMISVDDRYKRQGIAMKMLDHLRSEYGKKIVWGIQTEDGAALKQAFDAKYRKK